MRKINSMYTMKGRVRAWVWSQALSGLSWAGFEKNETPLIMFRRVRV